MTRERYFDIGTAFEDADLNYEQMLQGDRKVTVLRPDGSKKQYVLLRIEHYRSLGFTLEGLKQ